MLVSIVIVAYNEEQYLDGLFKDIENQTYDHKKIELVLIDSNSNDRTLEIFKKIKKNSDFFSVQILNNKEKYLPHGCNLAIDSYRGDIFIRIDAHAKIPSNFVEKNVDTIKNGEKICGGPRPNIIENATSFSELLLNIENAMFGSGFANYRKSDGKKYVKSIFHGAYHRSVFDRVGKYDEKLLRTEDNDMSYRIRKEGYKILYSPEIISYQYTRPTLFKMLKQKFLNGYWIGKTVKKDPKIISIFHFIPFVFLLSLIFCIFLTFFGCSFFLKLLCILYGSILILTTISVFIQTKSILSFLSPIILLFLHLSYGVGTLKGLLNKESMK